MSRTPGSKNFNRKLLQEVLAEKNIDLVKEYFDLLTTSEPDIKSRMLMHLMEFVYPKRRAEDSSGTPEDPANILIVTDDQLKELVKIARGQT